MNPQNLLHHISSNLAQYGTVLVPSETTPPYLIKHSTVWNCTCTLTIAQSIFIIYWRSNFYNTTLDFSLLIFCSVEQGQTWFCLQKQTLIILFILFHDIFHLYVWTENKTFFFVWLKVRISNVADASHYNGIVLEHKTPEGEVTDYGCDYTDLMFQMQSFYGNPVNRRRHSKC